MIDFDFGKGFSCICSRTVRVSAQKSIDLRLGNVASHSVFLLRSENGSAFVSFPVSIVSGVGHNVFWFYKKTKIILLMKKKKKLLTSSYLLFR